MKKTELINELVAKVNETSEETGFTLKKKDAPVIFDALKEVVEEALKDGDDVTIPGIAKIGTRIQAGREGVVNFGENKGQTWKTEDKTIPYFKAVASLKEAVAE